MHNLHGIQTSTLNTAWNIYLPFPTVCSGLTLSLSLSRQEGMGTGDVDQDQVFDAEHEHAFSFEVFISLYMPPPFFLSLPLCGVHHCWVPHQSPPPIYLIHLRGQRPLPRPSLVNQQTNPYQTAAVFLFFLSPLPSFNCCSLFWKGPLNEFQMKRWQYVEWPPVWAVSVFQPYGNDPGLLCLLSQKLCHSDSVCWQH